MRKLLLLVVAISLSIGVQAQLELNYQWASVLTSNNTTSNKGLNGLAAVVANADGDVFVLGQFGSLNTPAAGLYEYATYKHYDANGTLTTKDTPKGSMPTNLSSVNRDFLLYKMNKDGKIIWQLTGDRGYLDHSYSSITPTSDGGAVLALKVRHLNDNLFGENYLIRFVEEDGNKEGFEWAYPSVEKEIFQGVLVKVSAAGKVDWMKHIPVDYIPEGSEKAPAVTDAIYFGGLAVDESGNIYLGGRHVKTITFKNASGNNVSIIPQNTADWKGDAQSRGDMFLFKFDSNGNFIWNLASNGALANGYQNISDLSYNDGKLYIYGNIQGNGTSTTQLGDVVLKPTEKIDSYTARIDISGTNPQVDWVKHFKALPAKALGGRNKVTSINYQNGALFSSGSMNAIIADAEGNNLGEVTSAGQLKGFVIRQNAENGDFQSIYIDNVEIGIGEIENAYMVNNKVYALGHVMGTAYVYDMDSDLNNANKTAIFTSGSATSISSAFVNEQLIAVGRGQGSVNILKEGVLTDLSESFPAYSSIFASYKIPELATSISENIQQNKLIVYGGNGQITIDSSLEKEIVIYNVYGQIVKTVLIQEGLNVIEGMASGIYLVAKHKVIVR